MALKAIHTNPLSELSDEELVERFSSTQQEAFFAELYRRYVHLAYGVCLKLMKNEDDSRDVVADVFRILYQKLPSANLRSFKAYLYTVSRNECIGKLRKRKKDRNRQTEFQKTAAAGDSFMENEGFLSLMNSAPDQEKLVEAAVQELGDEQRTCVKLFFYQDKSYKEIADQTGFTEKQVKSYLQNGKRNLRIRLEKELRKLSA